MPEWKILNFWLAYFLIFRFYIMTTWGRCFRSRNLSMTSLVNRALMAAAADAAAMCCSRCDVPNQKPPQVQLSGAGRCKAVFFWTHQEPTGLSGHRGWRWASWKNNYRGSWLKLALASASTRPWCSSPGNMEGHGLLKAFLLFVSINLMFYLSVICRCRAKDSGYVDSRFIKK